MSEETEIRKCGDCDASPGEMHEPGCDVERCVLCGGQAISCPCVYEVNGLNYSTLEEDHPEIYGGGPTEEMWKKYDEETSRYGGPLLWTGLFPGADECRELNLYCFWGDQSTGDPMEFSVDRPGKWVSCEKDHPAAGEDLNSLSRVARWDRAQRKWVKKN